MIENYEDSFLYIKRDVIKAIMPLRRKYNSIKIYQWIQLINLRNRRRDARLL